MYNMFERIRQSFREAVENFREELNRDELPGTMDGLLSGMYRELTSARSYLGRLEDEVRNTAAAVNREEEELATCLRREELARRIGDEETARVAAEFAAKHQQRLEVLKEKEAALSREVVMRREEAEEMLARLQEARSQRDALAATAGRGSARESIRRGDDLFHRLDRMADRIRDNDALREAEALVDDGLGNPPPREPVDVDSRLEDLKRRMEETGG
jgi:phage shock protein A